MDFGKQCFDGLEKLSCGLRRGNSLYFTLDEIKQLPNIIKRLNCINDLVISPLHITDISVKVVHVVQNKFLVFLSDAGKSSIDVEWTMS
ncbi:hypothetical protein ACFSCX_09690 [Bacillus salitolerans]|uniref:Uncharacterized protein n=1 Tax=Bacillus salitolerans TaxID=1437434 RepID=A0ABW4LPX0_9BACI